MDKYIYIFFLSVGLILFALFVYLSASHFGTVPVLYELPKGVNEDLHTLSILAASLLSLFWAVRADIRRDNHIFDTEVERMRAYIEEQQPPD